MTKKEDVVWEFLLLKMFVVYWFTLNHATLESNSHITLWASYKKRILINLNLTSVLVQLSE